MWRKCKYTNNADCSRLGDLEGNPAHPGYDEYVKEVVNAADEAQLVSRLLTQIRT